MYHLQRAGVGVSTQRWHDVVRATLRLRPDVVSVDVFDTCLVRELVGDEAVEHLIERARNQPGDDAIDSAASEIERRLCRAVPGVAESLRQLRRSGAEVVFLTDTDRSSELLIDILTGHGLFVPGDRLIASCEAGTTKSDGGLYSHIWPATEGGRPTVWHVGNHQWADVTMAAAAGIRPIPVVEADANRYERAMAARQRSFGPALAGAARLARLEIDADRRSGVIDGHQAEVQMLGADVAGQTMAAFVLWVADRCREEGIDHLGFLARDGELPLKVASAIPADHWDGRSLRYIHCSRFTWSLAAASAYGMDRWLQEGTSEDGGFLLTKRHHVPFDALLARIGLTPADLAGRRPHRGLASLDPSDPLPEEAAADWEGLLADAGIHEAIAERSSQRLDLIVDWLRADGLPAGKLGLVDVGWRGRLASQVSAVVAKVAGEEPVHFHFGGDKVPPDVDARVAIRRFAFDGVSDPHPIGAPVSCIETLTASGKPRVVDFHRRADGEVQMVFDRKPVGETGDRSELWTGALRMAELVPSRKTLDDWGLEAVPLADEAVAVLDHWWNRPTEAEVHALAGLAFEHDEAGTSYRPLVNPYRVSELRLNGADAERQWPQGSRAISGPLMGSVVWAVRTYRSFRRRAGGRRSAN